MDSRRGKPTIDRLFLDANVLYSVAHGSPSIERLWRLQRNGQCCLLASRYVIDEAHRNLNQPEQRDRFQAALREVDLVPDAPIGPCPIDVPAKDRPVISAALKAKATHLITGDERDFGPYFGSAVTGMMIGRPSDYVASLSDQSTPAELR